MIKIPEREPENLLTPEAEEPFRNMDLIRVIVIVELLLQNNTLPSAVAVVYISVHWVHINWTLGGYRVYIGVHRETARFI